MADVKNPHTEQIDYTDNDKDKAAARQTSLFDEEIVKEKRELGDYSGAKAKTDPAEIALVRKLDRWIMPMLVSSIQRSNKVIDLTIGTLSGISGRLPRCSRFVFGAGRVIEDQR